MNNIDFSKMITAEARSAAETFREQLAKQEAARKYLTSTDWYVTRKVETGKKIPAQVEKDREAARKVF